MVELYTKKIYKKHWVVRFPKKKLKNDFEPNEMIYFVVIIVLFIIVVIATIMIKIVEKVAQIDQTNQSFQLFSITQKSQKCWKEILNFKFSYVNAKLIYRSILLPVFLANGCGLALSDVGRLGGWVVKGTQHYYTFHFLSFSHTWSSDMSVFPNNTNTTGRRRIFWTTLISIYW